jgi:hypothetical protein
VLNQAPRQGDLWESGDTAPRILNLSTRRSLVTSRPAALTLGKEPLVSLDTRLCGSYSRSGRCDEQKTLPHPYWESVCGRPALSLVTILTELSRL